MGFSQSPELGAVPRSNAVIRLSTSVPALRWLFSPVRLSPDPLEKPLKTFQEIELLSSIHRALENENYHTPTAIQAATIPAALAGRDVLGCAQTGTGKTAAFAIPVLNHLGKLNRKAYPTRPFALVLAPTRELAVQIGQSFSTYGHHLRLRQAIVYGGVHQGSQVRALERGVHILVATPGRLLDLMNQEVVDLGRLELFVLDEADRMLDMGFMPDIRRIMAALPKDRQSLFFSATMPPKIVELSQQLLTDPVSIDVTPKEKSVTKIAQKVIYVDRFQRSALLLETLQSAGVGQAIVFTKTKHGADAVAEKLERADIAAAAIHGDKSQNQRQRTLDAMRRGQLQVLVATDVAARGIDIDGISHVINFDLPLEPENYTHRIGRTGRAGAEGIAISFCPPEQKSLWRDIERLIGKEAPVEFENRLTKEQEARAAAEGSKGKAKSKKRKPKPAHAKTTFAKTSYQESSEATESREPRKPKASWRPKKQQSSFDGESTERPARSGSGKPRPPKAAGRKPFKGKARRASFTEVIEQASEAPKPKAKKRKARLGKRERAAIAAGR